MKLSDCINFDKFEKTDLAISNDKSIKLPDKTELKDYLIEVEDLNDEAKFVIILSNPRIISSLVNELSYISKGIYWDTRNVSIGTNTLVGTLLKAFKDPIKLSKYLNNLSNGTNSLIIDISSYETIFDMYMIYRLMDEINNQVNPKNSIFLIVNDDYQNLDIVDYAKSTYKKISSYIISEK